MAIRSSRTTKIVLGWVVILALLVPVILQFAAITRADPALLWGIVAIVVLGAWLWRTINRAAGTDQRRDDLDEPVRRDDGW
ncbi:hypothetical protein [Myceligenerans pegani]|uniref:Uncharacterized protein n=1 Tax=Myceligenerans pegani TaxID=2776917 RepID=A0ABR9MSM5_9MICO|nr:hypothetical protein [Myceligenerans sp. TRM 65318]MBE1874135.1 hypothetical protein [Myceligenerans sp. TRM 65318]MBE3016407.1 hypothetical protein [Myceligenerans sp. TRM 65318]